MVKKIAIFQSDLRVGGIQKSLVNFLSMLPEDEFQADVFLYDSEVFYDLSQTGKNVRIFFLKPYFYANRFVYFKLLCALKGRKRLPDSYDLAIDFSSYWNECAIGALSVNAPKRVMWIHNDVLIKKQEEPKYRVLYHFFKGKYRRFDEFAAVSKGIVEPFRQETGMRDAKIHVVPNFINTKEIHQKSEQPIDFTVDPEAYNLCSVGRLCHQKGFDLLLNEFSEVMQKRADMHLYLIGEGPDKAALKNRCSSLGIEKSVTFLGNQANPFPYMNQMDGLVLDSRYEGQGMVLWEAKALGLELFMPKRLEKYNEGLTGCEDIAAALLKAKKNRKEKNDLADYNQNILERIRELF